MNKKIIGILVCMLLVIPVLLVVATVTETKEEPVSIGCNRICELGETPKICPEDCKELNFLSVQGDKIVDSNGEEVMLRGLHYDAFYVFGSQYYFAEGQDGRAIDSYNTDLAGYLFADEDIGNFKELGANVVRLEFRLWEIEKEPYVYSEESLVHLDNTIDRFGKNGIYVILDLHAAGQNALRHNEEYGNLIWYNESFRDRVVALWGVLAERYSNNSYIAGYDIVNEPQAPDRESLHDFYQHVIDKVREYDNNHILFLELNLYRKEDILIGGVYNDDNLAVSMHFYKPNAFTNQGLHGNPTGQVYPGTYDNVYWDKNELDSQIGRLLGFDEIAGKPMFLGEFSANVIDGGDYALKWIDDVFDVLKSKGVHYTFFNYKFSMNPSFGYYYPSKELEQKIMDIQTRLKNGELDYENLTGEQKEYLLTINYESNSKLKQILKKGFGNTVSNLTVNIEKPKENHFYMFNRAIMPLKNTIILGKITIRAEVYSINDLDRVEFYIDDVLKNTDMDSPYEWLWDEKAIGNHEVTVVAYGKGENESAEKIEVKIFNFG
jgi:hypothetical protein